MHGKRRQSHRSSGFTLIELLVVVFLGALLSAIVLLSGSLNKGDRDVQQEARRLASLLELVADEAELQGRDFGVEFISTGYRFVEFDPIFERWTEVIGDGILEARALPEDFEFELYVEDRRIELAVGHAATEPEDEDDDSPLLERYAPHALLLSSGDRSPFDVDLIRRTDEATVRVAIELNGTIRIGPEDDEALN